MTKTKDRYMLVRYLQKPKDPKGSTKAGYMKNPDNVRFDEQVAFSVGIRSRDMVEYQVVLNLDQQKIEKNNLNENYDWNSIWGYFSRNYGSNISRYLNQTNHIKK